MYIPFWERSLALTNESGTATLITPSKWLSVEYGANLRAFLAEKIQFIVDLTAERVFEEAGVASIIVMAGRKTMPACRVICPHEDGSYVSVGEFFSDFLLQAPHWGVLLSPFSNRVSTMIKNGVRLDRLASVDEPWYIDPAYRLREYVREAEHESGTLKLLTTGLIDPYVSLWGAKVARYLKAKYLRPVVLASDLKEQFPSQFAICNRPKIVLSGMRHFEAFFDSDASYLPTISTVVVSNIETIEPLFLLALLNSASVKFFMTQSYRSQATDGGINFTRRNVGTVPIPQASIVDQDVLAAFAAAICDSKAADPDSDVTELVAEIDARVEFLYFHRGERGTRTNKAGEEVPYPDTYDEWVALLEAEAGNNRETISIIADNVQGLDRPRDDDAANYVKKSAEKTRLKKHCTKPKLISS